MKTRIFIPPATMGFLLLASLLLLYLSSISAWADSTVATEWPGMRHSDSSAGVPDPHGVAGPRGVLQTVNWHMTYFDKAGTRLWDPVKLGDFWSSVGNTGGGNADPKVVFDSTSGRFYVIMQENTASQSFLNVAVSKSGHPATSTESSWFLFRLEMTEQIDGNPHGGDYPGLAVDAQAVYVTYNMFKLPIQRGNGDFRRSQIIILDKADLNRGVLTFKRRDATDRISWTLVPATVIGASNPGNKAYFVQVSFPISLFLWTLEDPLGSATLSGPQPLLVPVNAILPTGGAPQQGTSRTLETMGGQLRAQGNAFWRDGALWFTYTGGDPVSGHARVHYYRIDTETFPLPSVGIPNFTDPGFIDLGPNDWTFQPAIGGNACGDVCLVFSASSPTETPLVMCAIRPRNATRFDIPFVVHRSPTSYRSSNPNNDGTQKWGDYATVSADPNDGSFWISHEWARSAAIDDWGTWWAQIQVTPPAPNHWYVNSEFCAFRTGDRDCQLFAGPFERVRDAVGAAGYGDVVHIHGGRYDEPMTLTKCMVFRANEGNAEIGR